MQWALDLLLIGLLGATLMQALRLERALGVLRRDRAALQDLVDGFNASTRQAEQGIERLRLAADGAGRQVARQVEAAATLKDDLSYLAQRGDSVADRLDALVRVARTSLPEQARPESRRGEPVRRMPVPAEAADAPRVRSQAERDLLKALRLAR